MKTVKAIEQLIQKYRREDEIKEKENNDFIYNMLFRTKPPSIIRLACMQLIKEGVNFADESSWDETWNLIWDRAEFILNKVQTNGDAKKLHRSLLNQRANEEIYL